MKTLHFIGLLFLCAGSTQAQGFFTQGDKWTYRQFQFAPPWLEAPSTFQVRVDRDTMIQNKQAVILRRDDIAASETIIHTDSQKVWIWRDNAFRLFVDFNLQTGDTMSYYVPYEQGYYDISCGGSPSLNDLYRAVIDSISYFDMNGFPLKQLHTRNIWDTIDGKDWELGVITEGIGSDQGFWGRSSVQCLAGFWGNLACYYDTDLGAIALDTLDCAVDSSSLPFPNYMLQAGFQWQETEIGTQPYYNFNYYTVEEAILLEGESWHPICQLFTNPFDTIASQFFLRMDTAAAQLYFRQSLDSAARILYDYNLNIGSILDPALYGMPIEPNSWVSSVDTFVVEGQLVRYFELNGGSEGLGLYEGFVGSKGLFYGLEDCLCGISLSSVQLKGQSIFGFHNDPIPKNCSQFLVSNESDLSHLFNLLQSDGQLEIRPAAQNAQSVQIQLFNMQGQSVYADKFIALHKYRLSTQAFPAGAYLLRISQGQQSLNRKIIINH